ncbi:MAG: GNAT family protein [Patescibacteria group bacterium]|nr:GNAT family protein [Patescibacteria group bacterium]
MKLIGQKINLRYLKASDAKSIYQNIKDRDIIRHLSNVPEPYQLKQAVEFIKRCQKKYKKQEAFPLGIAEKNSDQIIGVITIADLDLPGRRGVLGYWLGKKYHRQGIMSEALQLMLDFSFGKLKLKRVWAEVMDHNIASALLLEKYGFQKEGCLRQHLYKNRRYCDSLVYGLLREDYKIKNKKNAKKAKA